MVDGWMVDLLEREGGWGVSSDFVGAAVVCGAMSF